MNRSVLHKCGGNETTVIRIYCYIIAGNLLAKISVSINFKVKSQIVLLFNEINSILISGKINFI